MREITSTDDVKKVLENSRIIAVLGAHPSQIRPAHYVPEYLHQMGYHILPVNVTKAGEELWGEVVRARLDELATPVDVVDVFRRPDHLMPHLDEILAMNPRPKLVWLQKGIANDDFAQALIAEGIEVIQDRCMLADHKAFGLGKVG